MGPHINFKSISFCLKVQCYIWALPYWIDYPFGEWVIEKYVYVIDCPCIYIQIIAQLHTGLKTFEFTMTTQGHRGFGWFERTPLFNSRNFEAINPTKYNQPWSHGTHCMVVLHYSWGLNRLHKYFDCGYISSSHGLIWQGDVWDLL